MYRAIGKRCGEDSGKAHPSSADKSSYGLVPWKMGGAEGPRRRRESKQIENSIRKTRGEKVGERGASSLS